MTRSVGGRWPGEIAEHDIHTARWLVERGYAEELTTTEQAEIITAPIRR